MRFERDQRRNDMGLKRVVGVWDHAQCARAGQLTTRSSERIKSLTLMWPVGTASKEVHYLAVIVDEVVRVIV